ncbi:MAG: PKD domain-containing protein [Candidatus Thermoplasmatota archaeon]
MLDHLDGATEGVNSGFTFMTYVSSGAFYSSIYDTHATTPQVSKVNWSCNVPANTQLTIEIRSSENTDMSNPTDWFEVFNGQTESLPQSKRYIQYRATLSTTDTTKTPTFIGISINYFIDILRVEVSINNSPWMLANGTNNWYIILNLNEDLNTIYAKATYSTGDYLITKINVTIDTTSPIGSIKINDDAISCNSNNVVLTLLAYDKYGVKEIMLCNDKTFSNSYWESYSPTKAWSLLPGDGNKTVYVKFKDNNGLVSIAYSDSIILDTTLPTGSIEINDGDEYTTNATVKLTLNANNKYGIAKMMISNTEDFEGTFWEQYSTTKYWNLSDGGGLKTVYVKYMDNNGLISQVYSDKIILDTTPPTGIIYDDGEFTENITCLHAVLSFKDLESGIELYEYSIGTFPGSADVFLVTSTHETKITVSNLNLLNSTKYYFNVRAKNKAGIWSKWQSTDGITVNVSGPISKISYPNGALSEEKPIIEIKLSSKDLHSYKIVDGDLEFRKAKVSNGAIGKWSYWEDFGDDYGDLNESYFYEGMRGYAYQFRYRAKNIANAVGNWNEIENITRIDCIPKPDAGKDKKARVDEKIKFDASASSDDDGDILTYYWDFGDGSNATGVIAFHKYSKSGKYEVILTVNDGNFSSTTKIKVLVEKKYLGIIYEKEITWLLVLIVAVIIATVLGAVYLGISSKKRAYALPPTPPIQPGYVPPQIVKPVAKEEKPLRCPNCNNEVEKYWSVCPHCKEKLDFED